MDCKALIPEFGAILVAVRVEQKETNVATTELDVQAGHGRPPFLPNNLLDAKLEILRLRSFKGDGEELVNNGRMNPRNGVTEKDDENLLRAHTEERAQSNLRLIRECLCLIKDDNLRTSGHKQSIKGGTDEGVHAAAYSL